MKIDWRNHTILGKSADQSIGADSGVVVVDTDADPRDLTFRPIDPAHAKTLQSEQVARYNADGFLAPVPIFSAAEIEPIRRYVEDLVTKVSDAPDRRNAYSIINYHIVCRGLYDIVQTPAILDRVEDLLGPDFVCWNTHLFCKSPGDPMVVPFHQDSVYWPLSPPVTVTAWLALDDADEENAAVQFVPGSHLAGPLRHEQRPLDGTRTLKREAVDLLPHLPRYVNTLRAGSISFHSDLMLHGSAANTSNRRRSALAIRYAATTMRPLPGAEWYLSATVACRGDVPDHLRTRRRPSSEHPELLANVWGDFDGTAAED